MAVCDKDYEERNNTNLHDTQCNQFALLELSPGTYHVPPLGYGGCERVIFGLAKAISRKVKVGIVDFGPETDKKLMDGIPVFLLGNRFRLERSHGLFLYNWNALTSAFVLFYSILKGELPRYKLILHFHHGTQFSVFWVMQKIFLRSLKVNYVYSHHSPKWMNPVMLSFLQRILAVPTELFSIEHSDFVTFESDALAKEISRVCVIPRHRMVLANGVDVDVFDKKTLNVETESFKIFYGARIKKQKDQITVVRALASVLQVEPKARLILLGDPEESDYYELVKKEVLNLGLGSSVEFHPSVTLEKLNRIRARYAIHVIYSCFTGFDVALGETLSLGVACILSNIPPVNGIAIDGVNCLLVPPNNEAELATAIIKLLRDPALRARLGEGARKTAAEKLSWTVLSEKFIGMLRNIPI